MKVGELVRFDMGGDGPPPAPQYTKMYAPRNPGLVVHVLPGMYRILWRNGEETWEHRSYLKRFK